MTVSIRFVLFGLAVLCSGACGLTGPDEVAPQLISVQVLEGLAPCRGCPVEGSGRDVTPGPDNVLTIKPNTFYTFRAVVRTAFNNNRCVYNVFRVGWDLPDRSWDCIAETKQDITIDKVTGRTGVPLTEDDIIKLVLAEWTIDKREQLSSTELHTYTVRFAEEGPNP